MNIQSLKSELLGSTAQVVVFDVKGKLLSSCNTLFQIPDDVVSSLFDVLPVLESMQYSFMELKQEDELKFPCMWFDSFGASGYYDFTFIKKEMSIIWLIQDFNDIYKSQINVQQERNESIINSELLELHHKTQEELRKVGKEYKHLFDNTLDLIQSIDADGKFIFTNPAWRSSLNYTESELAEMTFFDVIHPDDTLHCEQLFDSLRNQKRMKDVEIRFLDKNGMTVYVQGTINTIIDNGQSVSSQGIFKDITEKKLVENQLRQSEALYRLLVENASDIICMTNTNGQITYMNSVGLEFTGNSEVSVKSIPFTDWVHPRHRLKTKNFYLEQISQKKKSTYLELPGIVKNKNVWMGQNVNLLFDMVDGKEEISGFLVIARDITKQKELEDTLNKTNEILDKKVKERTLALNQSNEELTLVNNELDSFLYKSSHNLKGPIARISGLSNLMKLKGEEPNISKHLELIDKEVYGINHLIGQLTSYHIIYSFSSSSPKEKIDIKRLINNTLLSAKHKAGAGLTNSFEGRIDVAKDVQLTCNIDLLTLVLENILNNSFKFKKGRSNEVHIVSISVKMAGDLVEITIRDNGEGVPNESLKNIFNMFYKGTQKHGGHGLGLYLANKAVKKLHGKIEVSSDEGKFTEFKLFLPTK